MKLHVPAIAAAALLSVAMPLSSASAAGAGVKIGMLECTVAGGTGFIIGSSKSLSCFYNPVSGPGEAYTGTISKFGLDIGTTGQTKVAWGVLAPTADVAPGALEGHYVGVSAEATVGAGVGANALIGGLDKSITLNPVSVQVQNGLNIAAGIASLELREGH